MRRSYLDYAMSVIVSRALPDARDGLKPVHRRILFGMHEAGYSSDKPYRKSARVVGDVMGKYHPHGDSAIYDAMVRMAQTFSLRVPLIDGQGNFGSVDGDNPAAMRYTEVRLARSAALLLDDIDRSTVDFQPNYDESEHEPKVLPARFPNLLINGANGIAVGMATNIPPHNPGEIIDATLALIANPDTTLDELMRIVPGPDFPTGGIILGRAGIRSRVRDRARVDRRPLPHRDRGDPQGPLRHHRQRDPLPGEQEDPAGAHLRTGARQAGRGHLGDARRERPLGDADRDRAAARGHARGGAEPVVPLHPDADQLRHQRPGAGQRPAQADGAEGRAGVLHPLPRGGHHPPRPPRSRQGARPGAQPRRPRHRRGQHRRGDQADPRQPRRRHRAHRR